MGCSKIDYAAVRRYSDHFHVNRDTAFGAMTRCRTSGISPEQYASAKHSCSSNSSNCTGSTGAEEELVNEVAQLTGKSPDEIRPLMETIYGKPGEGGTKPGSASEVAAEIQKRSESGVGCKLDTSY